MYCLAVTNYNNQCYIFVKFIILTVKGVDLTLVIFGFNKTSTLTTASKSELNQNLLNTVINVTQVGFSAGHKERSRGLTVLWVYVKS